ncbi:hypothetical protein [Streptomyces sp. NPDC059455]|uniref:hypothetical protein n=1 Tax=Streptomyces sp. NPDC059455 TaxID=3346837 RepID=UPI0036A2114A
MPVGGQCDECRRVPERSSGVAGDSSSAKAYALRTTVTIRAEKARRAWYSA